MTRALAPKTLNMSFKNHILRFAVLYYLSLFLVCFLVILGWRLGFSNNRKRLRIVEEDWTLLLTAFREYGVMRGVMSFPPDTIERRKEQPSFPLTFETETDFITKRKIGREGRIYHYWVPLTTPLAYLPRYPDDPFRPGSLYGYTCWNFSDDRRPLAILHSPGPDFTEDVSLALLREKILPLLKEIGEKGHVPPIDMDELGDLIAPCLYDPTNGAKSRGDLIWFFRPNDVPYGWKRPWRDVEQ